MSAFSLGRALIVTLLGVPLGVAYYALTGPSPELRVTEISSTVDVHEGVRAQFTFSVVNPCPYPITVTSLRPSCGCIATSISRIDGTQIKVPFQIKPNEPVEIDLSVETVGLSGRQQQLTQIAYEERGESKVSIAMCDFVVRPGFRVLSSAGVVILKRQADGSFDGTITIGDGIPEAGLKIERIRFEGSDDVQFNANYKPINSKEDLRNQFIKPRYEISISGRDMTGESFGMIVVEPSDDLPPLNIPISIKDCSPNSVRLFPSRLILRRDDLRPGKPITKKIVIEGAPSEAGV